MEWIETTARTVEEALDQALDKLGVDEDEVEFEVLEEPKAGLFGRVRGQARLRARVEPRAPRAKTERKERRRKPKSEGGAARKNGGAKSGAKSGESRSDRSEDGRSPSDGGGRSSSSREGSNGGQSRSNRGELSDLPDLDNDAVVASSTEFLSGLVGAFGYDGEVSSAITENVLELGVDGKYGLMVGPKARTMDAIQELTRTVVQRAGNSELRIRVDIGGYRQLRREALEDYAAAALAKFEEDGGEVALESMPSADRKIVHDALSEADGIVTRSDGREPRRRIIIEAAQ